MGSVGAPELIVFFAVVAVVAYFGLRGRGRSKGDTTPCRACERPVSPRAKTCPHCGEPRLALRG